MTRAKASTKASTHQVPQLPGCTQAPTPAPLYARPPDRMMNDYRPSLQIQELGDLPILICAVGQVAPNDEGDHAEHELLLCNEQRICFAIQLYHHWSVHADL